MLMDLSKENKKKIFNKEYKTLFEYVFQNDIRKLVLSEEMKAWVKANSAFISYNPSLLNNESKPLDQLDSFTRDYYNKPYYLFDDAIEEDDFIKVEMNFFPEGSSVFGEDTYNFFDVATSPLITTDKPLTYTFKIAKSNKKLDEYIKEVIKASTEETPIDLTGIIDIGRIKDTKDFTELKSNGSLANFIETINSELTGTHNFIKQRYGDDPVNNIFTVVSSTDKSLIIKYKVDISNCKITNTDVIKTLKNRTLTEDHFIYFKIPYTAEKAAIHQQEHPQIINAMQNPGNDIVKDF